PTFGRRCDVQRFGVDLISSDAAHLLGTPPSLWKLPARSHDIKVHRFRGTLFPSRSLHLTTIASLWSTADSHSHHNISCGWTIGPQRKPGSSNKTGHRLLQHVGWFLSPRDAAAKAALTGIAELAAKILEIGDAVGTGLTQRRPPSLAASAPAPWSQRGHLGRATRPARGLGSILCKGYPPGRLPIHRRMALIAGTSVCHLFEPQEEELVPRLGPTCRVMPRFMSAGSPMATGRRWPDPGLVIRHAARLGAIFCTTRTAIGPCCILATVQALAYGTPAHVENLRPAPHRRHLPGWRTSPQSTVRAKATPYVQRAVVVLPACDESILPGRGPSARPPLADKFSTGQPGNGRTLRVQGEVVMPNPAVLREYHEIASTTCS
uniref:Retrotransposon protein, putative, unclassified n=1 Tax=Macrostomum lignano TaxID=282301 RepID=A0A1I8FJE4_9PLAT